MSEIATDQLIPHALKAAESAQYVVDLQGVGIVGLSLLLIVYVGGLLLKHYFLNGKRTDAEIGFLDHMSDRLKLMEEMIAKLGAENRTLILENSGLSARIALLEQHEAQVTKLQRILDQKDDKIGDMEIAIESLLQDKQQLELRVRALEKQLTEKCAACDTGYLKE